VSPSTLWPLPSPPLSLLLPPHIQVPPPPVWLLCFQVARVTSAVKQPNSAKLLKLQADLGEGDVRQIMAGTVTVTVMLLLHGARQAWTPRCTVHRTPMTHQTCRPGMTMKHEHACQTHSQRPKTNTSTNIATHTLPGTSLRASWAHGVSMLAPFFSVCHLGVEITRAITVNSGTR